MSKKEEGKKWHTTLNPNNILVSKKSIHKILSKGKIDIKIN